MLDDRFHSKLLIAELLHHRHHAVTRSRFENSVDHSFEPIPRNESRNPFWDSGSWRQLEALVTLSTIQLG